jgi:outer membrane protein assembly factor BamB
MKFLLPVIASVLLSGCNSIMQPFGTDNLPAPAPLANFTPERTVIQQWSTKVGSGVGDAYLKLSPAYSDGVVYAADKTGRVVAINATSGASRWEINTKLPITSGLAVREGMLILGTNDGQVLALSTQDGRILWRAQVSNQILATPTLLTDAALIKTIDGQVCSLTLNTGKQKWCHDHGAPTMILRGSSSPQYADGLVVAGFADGKLAAYHVETGKMVWERALAVPKTTSVVDQLVDIDVDPRIANGVIYVATYQGHVAAVSLRSGDILWEHAISSYSGLALGQRLLFVSDAQSTVWAFDRDEGFVVWQQKVLANRFITGPALMDNTLVVGDAEGYLHWLAQKDGHLMARVQVEKKHGMIAAPLVSPDETVYVNLTDGKLNAYRLK